LQLKHFCKQLESPDGAAFGSGTTDGTWGNLEFFARRHTCVPTKICDGSLEAWQKNFEQPLQPGKKGVSA